MSCEFLGYEYHKDKERIQHDRSFCTATDEPCLVDEPYGPESCCRRTFLLMQKPSAPPEGTSEAKVIQAKDI
jgi:hypothetical protein